MQKLPKADYLTLRNLPRDTTWESEKHPMDYPVKGIVYEDDDVKEESTESDITSET